MPRVAKAINKCKEMWCELIFNKKKCQALPKRIKNAKHCQSELKNANSCENN